MNLSFEIKRAISEAIAVFLAVIVSHFYRSAEPVWMIVSAWVVMQASLAIRLRQGILIFFFLVFAVTVGTFYGQKTLLFPRLYDVTLGSMLGMICHLFILPAQIDVEFRRRVAPILQVYEQYLKSISSLLFKKELNQRASDLESQVQSLLQSRTTLFPDWIYEKGLSITFQQGHRHFLLMIERLSQILFSMHYLARYSFDPDLINPIQEEINLYVESAQHVLQAIVKVLNLQKVNEQISDLKGELAQLEKMYKQEVPQPLTLSNLQSEEMMLAAFIVDLRDFRDTVIKLGRALKKN